MGRKVLGWYKRPSGISVGRRKPNRSGEQIRPKRRWESKERLLSLLGGEGGQLFKDDLMTLPGVGRRALGRAMPWVELVS